MIKFFVISTFLFSMVCKCFSLGPGISASQVIPPAGVTTARGYCTFVEITEEENIRRVNSVIAIQALRPGSDCYPIFFYDGNVRQQTLALIRNPLEEIERIILFTQEHDVAGYNQTELIIAKTNSLEYLLNYETHQVFLTYEGVDNLFYLKKVDLSGEYITLIDDAINDCSYKIQSSFKGSRG